MGFGEKGREARPSGLVEARAASEASWRGDAVFSRAGTLPHRVEGCVPRPVRWFVLRQVNVSAHDVPDDQPRRRTPLFDWHISHAGRMVEFGGWEMPIQYRSILAEHAATRENAGLFDVSHMGRLAVSGPGAADWLEGMLTRRTSDLCPGGVRYTLVTDDEGRVLDDALVGRDPVAPPCDGESGGPTRYSLVVNASNRKRVVSWLRSQLPPVGVQLDDRTLDTAMIAIQGPKAVSLVGKLCDTSDQARSLEGLRTYASAVVRIAGLTVSASRTGYTGEDGLEVIVAASDAERLWTAILDEGRASGAEACGLGARDTLRLEAGMPLYGHELVESSDPFALGIGFAVTLEGRVFPGRDRLARLASSPPVRRRVGLVVESGRPAREGAEVVSEAGVIGRVTSGSYSPSLGLPIAMATVDVAATDPTVGGLCVDVRGRREPVRIVPLPFYSRRRSGAMVSGASPARASILLSSGPAAAD